MHLQPLRKPPSALRVETLLGDRAAARFGRSKDLIGELGAVLTRALDGFWKFLAWLVTASGCKLSPVKVASKESGAVGTCIREQN